MQLGITFRASHKNDTQSFLFGRVAPFLKKTPLLVFFIVSCLPFNRTFARKKISELSPWIYFRVLLYCSRHAKLVRCWNEFSMTKRQEVAWFNMSDVFLVPFGLLQTVWLFWLKVARSGNIGGRNFDDLAIIKLDFNGLCLDILSKNSAPENLYLFSGHLVGRGK